MPGTLIEILPLSHGLRLEVWDQSRIIAGDRWVVRIEARMDVPLGASNFDASPNREIIFSVMTERFGGKMPYSSVQEKHFVKRFVISRYRDLKRKEAMAFGSAR